MATNERRPLPAGWGWTGIGSKQSNLTRGFGEIATVFSNGWFSVWESETSMREVTERHADSPEAARDAAEGIRLNPRI